MAQITNKLLREAIADAEAVRETAVANAKLVLEESITPQIREMIARRLRVEAEHPESEEELDEAATEEGEEDEEIMDEAVGNDPGRDNAKEQPFEKATNVGGGKDFPADDSKIGSGENTEPSDDASYSSEIGNGGENVKDSSTDWYDDWSDSDFDLNEIISQLEEDIAAMSAEEDVMEGEDMTGMSFEGDMGDEDVLTQTHPHAHAHAGLKRDGVDADEAPVAPEAGMDDEEEELDLESILQELEAEMGGEEEEGEDAHGEMATDVERLKGEVNQYRESLREHQIAVKTLRDRLQEVNLLNAKLLFTNKMFRKDTLTNEQKIKIVESFDRATSVREVKLVYAALVENLGAAARSISNSRKKVVAEGLASRASRSTAPAAKKEEVIVENAVASRLQQLAGII